MAEQWPASLPQYPLLQGYDEQPKKAYVEFETDSGIPLRRKKTDAPGSDVRAVFLMDDTQYNTFVTFWEDTIDRGAIAVTWVDFKTDVVTGYYINTWRPEFYIAFGAGGAKHRIHMEMRKITNVP